MCVSIWIPVKTEQEDVHKTCVKGNFGLFSINFLLFPAHLDHDAVQLALWPLITKAYSMRPGSSYKINLWCNFI